MNKFASKEKGYNRQLATAYIAGMMIGSYFYKSIYCSMLEEKILRQMAQLDRDLLRQLQELKCQIRCRRQGENYLLEFDTGGFETLDCIVDEKGGCRILDRGGNRHPV